MLKVHIVSGNIRGLNYIKWIRKRALESDLCGSAQNLHDGSIKVIVSGQKEAVKQFRAKCEQSLKKAKVTEVKEDNYKKPIKAGFEIKDMPKWPE